jgi:hypothetical protein
MIMNPGHHIIFSVTTATAPTLDPFPLTLTDDCASTDRLPQQQRLSSVIANSIYFTSIEKHHCSRPSTVPTKVTLKRSPSRRLGQMHDSKSGP